MYKTNVSDSTCLEIDLIGYFPQFDKLALCTGAQLHINPISVPLGLIQNGVSGFGESDGNRMTNITAIATAFRKKRLSSRAFFSRKTKQNDYHLQRSVQCHLFTQQYIQLNKS
jgi:hypothetical protein